MSPIFKDISDFEVRLSLPNGFYDSLLKEDDWSFIIKLSALFEASCTQILAVRLRSPELVSAFSYLEQGNTKCGKIVLLKELDAITSKQAKVLSVLASLRNKLVHNISNVGFSFSRYIQDLNIDDKNNFVNWFGHGLNDEIKFSGKVIPKREFVLSNPKLAVWTTSAEILACLYLEIERVDLKIESEALGWSRKT